MEKFKISVEDWTKINSENAKFILEEAKDYTKYLSDSSDKITNRAFAILAILIPITSALIIFVVNEEIKPVDGYKTITYLLFVVIMGLIAIMFGISKIVFPRMFMPLGREPRDMCSEDLLGVGLTDDLAKLSIILSEIEASQVKIDYNEQQIAHRTTLLKNLMLSIGILFALIVLTLLVLLFKDSGYLCG